LFSSFSAKGWRFGAPQAKIYLPIPYEFLLHATAISWQWLWRITLA
jgi:hypothetical protein